MSIAYYNALGSPYAWRQRASFIGGLEDSVISKVAECVTESEVHYGFSVRRIFAKLRLDFLLELVASGRYQVGKELSPYNEKINSIIHYLCPQAEGHDRASTIRHVLCVEPKEELLTIDWAERGISPVPIIEACRDYFSTTRYNEVAVVVQDMILMPCMGYGNHAVSCIAVRLRPIEEPWKADLHVPIVPLHFLNHIAACEINKIILGLLEQNDLSSEDYWSSFTEWRSFENYEREFLQRRVQAERLIQRASEADEFQIEDLEAQHIYKSEFHAFPGLLRVQNPHVWWAQVPVPVVARSEHENSRQRLRKSLKRMRDRIRTLEDFLRDAAVADLSRTNLKLARSVQTLSWIVLLVSVLSLAVSAVPDDTKASWWKALTAPSQKAITH